MKKLLLILVALILAPPAAATAPLPSDSIYQASITLTNQDGQVAELAIRRGTPQLVSMFYTSCTMVCPMIIQNMQATRRAAGISDPERLSMLAVSFDPGHDGVDALRDYAARHKLDLRYWTLAHASERGTRTLAALLGVQYKALEGGHFNHTSVLLLLDGEGRIVARSEDISRPDPAFVDAVRKLTAVGRGGGSR